MTGITSRIIHSGLLWLRRKASTTSSRLTARARFWPSVSRSRSFSASSAISFFSFSLMASRSSSISISLTASAPMPARKLPAPQRASISRYLASVISSCFFRPVSLGSPGSSTMKLAK